MKVISSRLPSRSIPCVATIGAFDGIHRGHQYLLQRLVSYAQKEACASLVITFDTLPQLFLSHRYKSFGGCLTDRFQKTRLIQAFGVDYLWFLKTNHSFLQMTSRDFIHYLRTYFDVKTIVVGSDFKFGRGSCGNVHYLRNLGKEFGFRVVVIGKKQPAFLNDYTNHNDSSSKNGSLFCRHINRTVCSHIPSRVFSSVLSSSCVRRLVRRGDVRGAAFLLGRYFSIRGTVTRGRNLGSRYLVATANLTVRNYCIPAGGVFAAYARVGKDTFLSVVNIGIRPTVSSNKRITIEAHLIDFNLNIRDQILTLFFLEKIRSEHKFASFSRLKEAISKDIIYTRSKYSILPSVHPQPLVL